MFRSVLAILGLIFALVANVQVQASSSGQKQSQVKPTDNASDAKKQNQSSDNLSKDVADKLSLEQELGITIRLIDKNDKADAAASIIALPLPSSINPSNTDMQDKARKKGKNVRDDALNAAQDRINNALSNPDAEGGITDLPVDLDDIIPDRPKPPIPPKPPTTKTKKKNGN